MKMSLTPCPTIFQEDTSAHEFQGHYLARELNGAVVTDLNTTGELTQPKVIVPGSDPMGGDSGFLREEVAETWGVNIQSRLHLHKLCWQLVQ